MGAGLYGLMRPNAPVNQDLWLAFLDSNLCPTGSLYVTAGVTVDGVAPAGVAPPAAITLPDGRSALAFRLNGPRTVIP